MLYNYTIGFGKIVNLILIF